MVKLNQTTTIIEMKITGDQEAEAGVNSEVVATEAEVEEEGRTQIMPTMHKKMMLKEKKMRTTTEGMQLDTDGEEEPADVVVAIMKDNLGVQEVMEKVRLTVKSKKMMVSQDHGEEEDLVA